MPDEADALLLQLTKSKAVPVSPALDPAAQTLVRAGHAELRTSKKGPTLVATDAGMARKKELQKSAKPAKPAKPAKEPKAGALDLDALEERLARRFEEILDRKLAPLLAQAAPAQAAAPPASAAPPADLPERLVQVTQRLARAHGGLVPLGELRHALDGVPRAALDAALLALEQSRGLYLKIANDPVAVPNPEDGIRIAGRGLVYYATLP